MQRITKKLKETARVHNQLKKRQSRSLERTPTGRPKIEFNRLSNSGKSMRMSRSLERLKHEYGDDLDDYLKRLARNRMKLTVIEANNLYQESNLTYGQRRLIGRRLNDIGKNFLPSERACREFLKEITSPFELEPKEVRCEEKINGELIQNINVVVVQVTNLLEVRFSLN